MSARTFAAVIMAICLLSGCIPYKSPLLIPSDGNYPGLSEASHADVVIVHGMCTHTGSWARESFEQMRQKLGMAYEDSPHVWHEHEGIQVWRTALAGQSRPEAITAYAVVWSGVTEPKKEQLCYDAKSKQGNCPISSSAPSRALLNSKLKSGLVSDCLSDAVLYMSEFGATIQDRVAQGLEAIGEQRMSQSNPLFVITESLGSKILADVLKKNSDAPEVLNAMRTPTAVYMAANQIPLLDLGATSEPSSTTDDKTLPTVQTLRSAFEPLVGKEAAEDIPFVLFSDPNDLLTYEIDEEVRHEHTTNVRIGVARNFWLFANPIKAHTGYLERPWVWREIVCGRPERCQGQ